MKVPVPGAGNGSGGQDGGEVGRSRLDRVRRDDGGDGRDGGDPALRKNGAKFLQRTFHAHPRRIFVQTQLRTHFGKLLVLKIPQ